MRQSCVLAALLLLVFSGGAFADEGAIGFRTIAITDVSRPGVGSEWRTLKVFVWYPAKGDSDPIHRSAYFAAIPGNEELSPIELRDVLRREVGKMLDEEATDERLDATLGESLPVLHAPHPAAGSFPLVLVSVGLNSAPNALSDVCERIAAAGFFVVAIPTPPLFEEKRLRFDQISIETIMRDLEVVIGNFSADPSVDSESIALAGWSIGSVAQTILQMRNPTIKALVSLDGGVGYDYGAALARESIWFDGERLTASLFDVRALGTTGVARDFTVLELPRASPSWRLESDSLTHADVTTTHGLLGSAITGATENSEVRDFVITSTILFLESALTDDDGSRNRLGDSSSATPKGVRLFEVSGTNH